MKIFVLLSRFPYPLDKGDKLRAYYQIKELSALHEVHLCCLDDSNVQSEHIKHLEAYCKSVNVIQLRKWQIAMSLFIGLFSSLEFNTSSGPSIIAAALFLFILSLFKIKQSIQLKNWWLKVKLDKCKKNRHFQKIKK